MPIIKINKNELFEVSIRKFKRLCEKSGLLSELKRREYYEKPSVKRKNIKNEKIKLFKKKKKIK